MPEAPGDSVYDALPADFTRTAQYARLSDAERPLWSLYNADAMHGLPLAIQVVGRRLEEEKVLEGMKLVECALRDSGRPFVQREF